MLASSRLYLVILSNLWLCPGGSVVQLLFRNPETEGSNPAPGERKVAQHEPQDEELSTLTITLQVLTDLMDMQRDRYKNIKTDGQTDKRPI
jgi:hypothetical protein